MNNTRSTVFFASVVLSLIFAWFFIWPSLQGIDLARKAIEVVSEDVRLLEEARDDIQQAVSFFSALSVEEKELIELAAPSFEDKVNAVVVLDRLARENGLIVNDITADSSPPTASGDMLSTIPVKLDLEGSYQSLKAFMVRAENSLRIFDVESMDIRSSTNEEEDSDIISANITGRVYFTNMNK